MPVSYYARYILTPVISSGLEHELHTIPYEIICLISGRVTRTYIWHGKQVTEENARLLKSEATDI